MSLCDPLADRVRDYVSVVCFDVARLRFRWLTIDVFIRLFIPVNVHQFLAVVNYATQ